VTLPFRPQPVKARSIVVRASAGDVSDRLEDALKVRRAPTPPAPLRRFVCHVSPPVSHEGSATHSVR